MASDSQGPVVVGIAIAFAVVTFVVICLRMFARVVVLQSVGVDDCKSSPVTPAKDNTD